VLTKPAGLFFWPGILLGLVCVAAWRVLRLKALDRARAAYSRCSLLLDRTPRARGCLHLAFPADATGDAEIRRV
jgi:hypothetical protein